MAGQAAERTETQPVEVSERTLSRLRVLRQTSANVAYSVLVSVLATALFTVGLLTLPDKVPGIESTPHQPSWFTFTAAIVLTHLF